jgi:hypothetical protein
VENESVIGRTEERGGIQCGATIWLRKRGDRLTTTVTPYPKRKTIMLKMVTEMFVETLPPAFYDFYSRKPKSYSYIKENLQTAVIGIHEQMCRLQRLDITDPQKHFNYNVFLLND